MDVVRRNVARRNPHFPLRVVGGEQHVGLHGYGPRGDSAVLERLSHDYHWGNQRARCLLLLLRNSTISQVEPPCAIVSPIAGTGLLERKVSETEHERYGISLVQPSGRFLSFTSPCTPVLLLVLCFNPK